MRRLEKQASIIPFALVLVGRTSDASSQEIGPRPMLKNVTYNISPRMLEAALEAKNPAAVMMWDRTTPAARRDQVSCHDCHGLA